MFWFPFRRAAVRSIVLITAVMWGGGCVSSSPSGLPSGAAAQVYILRGLWDVFSIGLNSLETELLERGIAAEALSGPQWESIAEAIEKQHVDSARRSPLVFVGHSYGSDDAIHLARALQAKGITVDLLLLLDSTDPPPIPANVVRCVHYYIPNALGDLAPDQFSGNPVFAAAGNDRTEIVNRIVSEEEFGPGVRGVDHFNLESSGVLHAAIVEEVERLLASLAAGDGDAGE